MSIVIKLPNHGESCYATDEDRLPIFLVDVTIRAGSDCIYIFAAWLYIYLKSSFFYMSNRCMNPLRVNIQVYPEHSKWVNKLSIVSTSCGQALPQIL